MTRPAGHVDNDLDCDPIDPASGGAGSIGSWAYSADQHVGISATGTATLLDNRLRAYVDADDEITTWLRIPLTEVPAGAQIGTAQLVLAGEDASDSPFNDPELVVWRADNDDWEPATVGRDDLTRDDLLTPTPFTSFDPLDWNVFPLDLSAWDSAADLADGAVTLGHLQPPHGTLLRVLLRHGHLLGRPRPARGVLGLSRRPVGGGFPGGA